MGVLSSDLMSAPHVAVIIPAFQPNIVLVELVQALKQLLEKTEVQTRLLIVNDGSNSSCNEIFDQLNEIPGVAVLEHAVNLGKGAALKTALNYALLKGKADLIGVVTADADGQHLPHDIVKVVESLMSDPASLHLGIRKFESGVPIRSKIGNVLTRSIFWFFTGIGLQDTQTGLRGFSSDKLPVFLRIKSNGYDFEFQSLFEQVQRGTKIREVPIITVYEPGNPTSHFNPLFDSAKIYFVFFRFAALSLSAAILDYMIFLISYGTSGNVFASVATSRCITGVFYFYVARNHVFKSDERVIPELIKFVMLVARSMFASYGLLLLWLHILGGSVVLGKIAAEAFLFFANFAVQRVFVFESRTDS